MGDTDELGLPPEYPSMGRRKWGFLWFTNKPYIVAKIILGNRQIRQVTKNINEKNNTINIGDKSYAVRPEAIFMEKIGRKHRPVCYYYFDNPNPVVMDFTKQTVVLNPTAYKMALDTKVIQDVLKPDMANLLLAMVIAAAVLGLIGTIISGYNTMQIRDIAGFLSNFAPKG